MAILDPFRPKWQNSDPKIRAEAVRRLGQEETDALGQVARGDSDPSIRRLAIKRIREPKLLTEIATGESDAGLKKLATEKADSFWTATAIGGEDQAASESALASIVDERAIVTEMLIAIHRAGAGIILTYWAKDVARWLDTTGG